MTLFYDSLTSDSTPSRRQGQFLLTEARGRVPAADRRMNQNRDGWTAPCKGRIRLATGGSSRELLAHGLKSGVETGE